MMPSTPRSRSSLIVAGSSPGDADAATPEGNAAATVARECVTRIGRFHLGDLEVGDRARPICDPVKARVMKRDKHPIAGEMGIGLPVAVVPKRDRDLERRELFSGASPAPPR